MWSEGYNPYPLQTAQQGYTYENYQQSRDQYPHNQWNVLMSQLYPNSGQ
jgi:hypothetical protein